MIVAEQANAAQTLQIGIGYSGFAIDRADIDRTLVAVQ